MQASAHVAMRSESICRPANRLRPLGVKIDPLSQSMDLMGATMAYPRNSEIFARANPRSISIR
jgi:hypothetical protein